MSMVLGQSVMTDVHGLKKTSDASSYTPYGSQTKMTKITEEQKKAFETYKAFLKETESDLLLNTVKNLEKEMEEDE